MNSTCWISLGANLGDRPAALQSAIAQLDAASGITVARVSAFYETPPWGKTDQPPFLNAAAELTTTLSPQALLKECQRIEQSLGRERHEHWGPRTIDLDLIFFGTLHLSDEALTLPHPRWSERAFVVQPIYDLAPDLIIDGVALSETLARLDCSDLQRAG